MKPIPTLLTLCLLGIPTMAAALGASSAVQQSDAEKEFDRRWSKVDQEDVDALLELADWAKSQKIEHKAKRCWRQILKLEPQNDEANRGLGNEKVGDKWYPPEEAKKVRAAKEAGGSGGDIIAEGKSEAGALTLPDEDGSKAKVSQSLEANREEAAGLKSRFIDELGEDESEFHVALADHTGVLVKSSQEAADQYVQLGEYVFRRLNWLTYGKLESDVFKPHGGRHLYFLGDRDCFEGTLLFLQKEYPEAVNRQTARYYLSRPNVGGWSHVTGRPMHIIKASDRSSTVANGMGHHWLVYHFQGLGREVNLRSGKSMAGQDGPGNLISWWTEGIGMWSSLDALGFNSFFRTTEAKYSNVGDVDKGKDSDLVAICYEVAAGNYGGDLKPKSFYQLSRTQLQKLNDVDLAMSWSVIDYLFKERIADWRKMIELGNRMTTFRAAFVQVFGTDDQRGELKKAFETKNDRMLDEIYTTVINSFEQQWKSWVLQNYRAIYEDPSKTMWSPVFKRVEQGEAKKDDKEDEDKPKKKKRRRR
ncbi:MAG: hypothetical protein R3F30_01225 [Planctomycetota bacterium]